MMREIHISYTALSQPSFVLINLLTSNVRFLSALPSSDSAIVSRRRARVVSLPVMRVSPLTRRDVISGHVIGAHKKIVWWVEKWGAER